MATARLHEGRKILTHLHNVAVLGCDEYDVDAFHRLVDIANVLRLDKGVLAVQSDELRKGLQVPLEARL